MKPGSKQEMLAPHPNTGACLEHVPSVVVGIEINIIYRSWETVRACPAQIDGPGSTRPWPKTPSRARAGICEYRFSIVVWGPPVPIVGYKIASGTDARTDRHASRYGAGSCDTVFPTTGSSLWLWTIAAPASKHRTASSAISVVFWAH